MAKTLDTTFVEDVHYALRRGLLLPEHLEQVVDATLPGLLEFGCLRWTAGEQIPALPPVIGATPLGHALAEVRSPLGLPDGRRKAHARDIGVRLAEFMVIEDEGFLTDRVWELYLARFSRSAEAAGLPRREAAGLAAALQEMGENAVLHSMSSVPALAGYHVTSEFAQFAVADVGIGILASLRTCSAYASVQTHREAVRLALRDGVSRFGPDHGGFGFGRVFKALVAHWGELRFRSGEACLAMSGTDLDADQGTEHFPPALPGFQVCVACRMRSPA